MAAPGAITFSQAMDEARRRQQAGELAGARAIYRQLLELEPDQPDALTMLASIAYRTDEVEQAAALIIGLPQDDMNRLEFCKLFVREPLAKDRGD